MYMPHSKMQPNKMQKKQKCKHVQSLKHIHKQEADTAYCAENLSEIRAHCHIINMHQMDSRIDTHLADWALKS